MIGEYCRKYRIAKNSTLKDVGGDDQIKNLSAFEWGRSSNINHLHLYFKLSLVKNDVDNFINGLKEVLENDITNEC